MGCVLNSSVRLEIGSGRSGHGLRCLEPGQKFRKFNSDHFPFFKNLYRTFASRVSLPWLEIGSGRSGNGLRCLEPGQKFRIFNSDHFTFLKNFNPTSGSRVSIFGQKFQIAQKNSSSRGGGGGHFSIVNKSPPGCHHQEVLDVQVSVDRLLLPSRLLLHPGCSNKKGNCYCSSSQGV